MMTHQQAEARAIQPTAGPSEAAISRALERMQELDRLGASPAEVMKALREAGIKDLEELVRRVIALPEPEPLDPFAFSRPPAGSECIVHRAPQVAFTVDDVLYDPEDIERFNGKPLHFIVRPTLNRDHALVAFVGDEWLQSIHGFFQTVTLSRSVAPLVGVQYVSYATGGYYYPPYHHGHHGGAAMAAGINHGKEIGWALARFCEHIHFKGSRLLLDKNKVWPDLTQVGMGFLAGDWNDKISSVLSDGATLVLFEHTHFIGDTLIIPATNEGNLVELGWNDRVSSIKNFGNIY